MTCPTPCHPFCPMPCATFPGQYAIPFSTTSTEVRLPTTSRTGSPEQGTQFRPRPSSDTGQALAALDVAWAVVRDMQAEGSIRQRSKRNAMNMIEEAAYWIKDFNG